VVYIEVPIRTGILIGYAGIIEKVKKAEAMSEETAKTAEQLNLGKGDRAFESMDQENIR
jgi:hypothetical protein